MKVKYTGASDEQVEWGHNDDPRPMLTIGAVYEVQSQVEYSFLTKLILKEYPDRKFNSVSFESADNGNE